MRRIAAVAVSFVLVALAGVFVVGTVTASAATCTGTVQITSMTANPPTVAPGGSTTVSLVAQNCTNQPIQANVQWYGRFLGPTGGIPAGCVVIDPLVLTMSLPANGSGTSSLGYLTFASCTATRLQVTATISAGGATLASQSATVLISGGSASPSPSPSSATCAVSYARQSEWSGGFVAQVTIANTGTAPISGWTLAFSFPGDQQVTNAWNATVTQTGTAVTVRNLGYNAVIAAGASTAFGFQGSWHTSDASPTAFTLNQNACTVR